MKNNITLTIHPATIFLVHFIFFLLYIIPKIIDNNGIGKTIKTIQPYSNVNGSGIWKSSIINDIIYNPIQIEAMENTNTNVKKIYNHYNIYNFNSIIIKYFFHKRKLKV